MNVEQILAFEMIVFYSSWQWLALYSQQVFQFAYLYLNILICQLEILFKCIFQQLNETMNSFNVIDFKLIEFNKLEWDNEVIVSVQWICIYFLLPIHFQQCDEFGNKQTRDWTVPFLSGTPVSDSSEHLHKTYYGLNHVEVLNACISECHILWR